MFIFKQKEVVLDCFTYSSYLLDNFAPSLGEKFYPRWWKNLPKDYRTNTQFWKTSTMKKCRGFIDYYRHSITLPLWSDLTIALSSKHDGKINWQFADRESSAVIHDVEQRQGWLDDDQAHLKLNAPWAIKSNDDTQFLWSFPSYNFSRIPEYHVLPGVVDFKWQNSVNINMLLEFKDFSRTVELYAGHPIVQLVPLTERKIKINLHQVSVSEFQDLIRVPVFTDFHKFKKSCPY